MSSSAAVAYDPEVLRLPAAIGKQPQWLASPSSRKVLRVGRRGTKTRFAMLAAISGHGPGAPEMPAMGGILEGGDVLWVAVDYPQLTTVLWREELVPRFDHLPYATLNGQDHTLSLDGLGTLFLRSSEALRGVRGMGKNLRGVVIDEAAHFDLEGALLNEVLPTLLDNGGWLILMSTTNAGPDGGRDEAGNPRTPSYFNQICALIRAGDPRFAGWEEFTGTAFDNPRLDPKNLNELIGLYSADSPSLKQEVYAELLTAGVGLALPKMSAERHMVPRYPVPAHWTQFGAFDWGFNHPWVFGWYACDEDGNVIKIDTLWGRKQLPAQIATTILSSVPAARPRFIVHAGPDIFTRKGQAVGFQGPTIAETLQQHGITVIRGNTERVLGLDNLRAYTDWQEAWSPERQPRFVLMDTAGNRRCLAQLQAMQIDPNNLEDALKVDADASGNGGDDSYDETRYGLMSRPLLAKTPPQDEERVGKSLGYDYEHHRPRVRVTAEDEMARIVQRAQPHATAGRFRVPVRRG